MKKKILIINGPNLNLLGQREDDIYGKDTLENIKNASETKGKSLDLTIDFFQSNNEGEIINKLHEVEELYDGLIINPAAYTHSSIAILDSLRAINKPKIEIHLSNIYSREEYRKKSITSEGVNGLICGFGTNSYILGIEAIAKLIYNWLKVMTKIDKTDIQNINLIIKETNLKGVSKVKIKKNNYEIEITSESISQGNQISQVIDRPNEKNEKSESVEEIDNENIVKSPMVGVAYLSADPNSAPYIKIGQHVKAGDTLLLIEAMKTFNEIKAPRSGIIKKIVVLNSQPVEYGDTLIIFE